MRNRIVKNAFAAGMGLLVYQLGQTAAAHHGLANFNLNVDITVSGTIRDIALINPHSWVYLDVRNDDGTVSEWKCELRGATVLRRSGWSEDMFPIGEELTITGSPDRFQENTCYTGTLHFADGRSIDRYGQMVEAELNLKRAIEISRLPNGDPDISGDWAAEQVVMTDPRGLEGTLVPVSIAEQFEPGEVPAGRRAFQGSRGTPESFSDDPLATTWERDPVMPLTEAGKAAIEGFDGGSTDNPRLNCQTTNILFDWSFDSPINHIEQTEDEIVLTYFLMNLERTIHLDEAFPDELEPSRAGYSTGRWEDDVLVVETKGFLPGILSADTRTPHSDAFHVIERFRLDPENGALIREYEATDGKYWTGTYRGRDVMYVSALPHEPYNCDDRSFKTDILED
ncbi:MAG: hypothetical protein JXB36_04400 [Gammaproteobacteria bacterium]|nr:hypothetical protein [Gammaproteobacteria bacterium]